VFFFIFLSECDVDLRAPYLSHATMADALVIIAGILTTG